MPSTFKRNFRIRTYECDPYNQLAPLNYLRFMQETAIDASAQVGYDAQKYAQIHRLWLIRETGLEIYRPLPAGERVEVETWVADFRRASSRRIYQFHSPGAVSLAASAYTDWVYIDTDTIQPVPIPNEVITAFFPEGTNSRPPRAPACAPAPPAPAQVYQTTLQVVWRDLDALMHVNNANYLIFAEECNSQALAYFSWPVERFQAGRNSLQVRQARIQYFQPAVLGDHLELTSWMYRVNDTRLGRHFDMVRSRDQTLRVQIDFIYEWIDLSINQAVAIPDQFIILGGGNHPASAGGGSRPPLLK